MTSQQARIRTTLTLTHPRVIRWVREQEAAGIGLSEAISILIVEQQHLASEVAFLRSVVLRERIAIDTAVGDSAQHPPHIPAAGTWNDFPDEYLEP